MKIKAFITSYDREGMLTKLVNHLNSFGIIPTIKDDGSEYEPSLPQYFRHEHRGKDGYWQTWNEMLKDCEASDAELFLFMPDDFQVLNVNRMIATHGWFKKEPYIYNLINDGREWEWINILPVQISEATSRTGFTDCGFFCNREALNKIGFYMDEIDPDRWKGKSSGVGHQLTKRLHKARVSIYKPINSLAYHGDHESKMHPTERLNNPLISI